MNPQRKILVVRSSLNAENLDCQPLTDRGFQLFEAATPPDIRSQCKKHDFDLIITGPPDKETDNGFSRYGYPDNVPLLCIGQEKLNNFSMPGFISSFATPPEAHELCRQAEYLSLICNLNRQKVSHHKKAHHLSKKLEQQQQSMKQHQEFLDVLASRDGLTGLFNRRHLNKVLLDEFEQRLKRHQDLCLLITDLDYFNELNKTSGRSYGDFVLNDFAARLTINTQPEGICFRFSGEAFVALLPNVALIDAITIAENIRTHLIEKPFIRGVEERLITISVGIVSLLDHRPDDPDEFITMAERALFLAKSEGRDRVVAYRPVAENPPNASHQSIVFLKETLTKIFERTRTSAVSSLQLLAKDIAGEKNKHHIKNVKTYVELLGQHLNLADPIIQTFKNAFTLHSSIRFLLHNEMINKVEKFSPGDRQVMNDFPYKINEITQLFDYFSNERDVLLHHGERYDGSGYPEGLRGAEIPLGARIFGIVDALAAMGSDRPHRKRLEAAEIIKELTNEAGKQFDPYLVIKILEIIKAHQLLEIDADSIDVSIEKTRNSFPDCSL